MTVWCTAYLRAAAAPASFSLNVPSSPPASIDSSPPAHITTLSRGNRRTVILSSPTPSCPALPADGDRGEVSHAYNSSNVGWTPRPSHFGCPCLLPSLLRRLRLRRRSRRTWPVHHPYRRQLRSLYYSCTTFPPAAQSKVLKSLRSLERAQGHLEAPSRAAQAVSHEGHTS
jgi:hypothetical protein